MLDGLLYQTGMSIDEHCTDTGGVTDKCSGSAISWAFASRRIRDLNDRRLYCSRESGRRRSSRL
ncbi:Tn3 family transposase [Mesorhizobium sp. M0045]|uniref:Tn3 family transposase n=1 Tax=Mesorhizobium sp. M0045 TaxID=2956857 RepID=UPI003335540D